MDARTTLHLKPPRSLLGPRPLPSPTHNPLPTAPRAFTASLSSTCPSLQVLHKLRGTIWPSSFAFRVNPQSGVACAIRATAIVLPTLVYTDGLGLPINYARALSTLPHLHTVRVALPYSPRGTHISLDPTAPPDPNAELWVGECERCVGAMYESLAFRTRYIARKQGVLLPNLTPSAAGADRLYRDPPAPALERVEWVFRESNRAIGEDASDPGWDEDRGNASDYAASDYGEEEREEEYDDYAWEEMEREMGVEPEREEVGAGLEQKRSRRGPLVAMKQKHASGDEEVE